MSNPGWDAGRCGRPTERHKTYKRDLVAAAVDAGEGTAIANRTEVQRVAAPVRCRAVVLCRRGDENAGDDK